MFHRTNRCLGGVDYVRVGGAFKIGARPFWGRGVFVLVFKYQHWLPEITYPAFKLNEN